MLWEEEANGSNHERTEDRDGQVTTVEYYIKIILGPPPCLGRNILNHP